MNLQRFVKVNKQVNLWASGLAPALLIVLHVMRSSMRRVSWLNDLSVQPSPAISFGIRLASSGSFKSLFRDGMALVEETAAYLDGDGREEAKRLPRAAALSYASESMRLTTRLMQIASWLLLQRAVNEGEMTTAEAATDKRRTRIAWQHMPTSPEAVAVLPMATLQGADRKLAAPARAHRAAGPHDERARGRSASLAVETRPLEAQMSRLREAFGD